MESGACRDVRQIGRFNNTIIQSEGKAARDREAEVVFRQPANIFVIEGSFPGGLRAHTWLAPPERCRSGKTYSRFPLSSTCAGAQVEPCFCLSHQGCRGQTLML